MKWIKISNVISSRPFVKDDAWLFVTRLCCESTVEFSLHFAVDLTWEKQNMGCRISLGTGSFYFAVLPNTGPEYFHAPALSYLFRCTTVCYCLVYLQQEKEACFNLKEVPWHQIIPDNKYAILYGMPWCFWAFFKPIKCPFCIFGTVRQLKVPTNVFDTTGDAIC